MGSLSRAVNGITQRLGFEVKRSTNSDAEIRKRRKQDLLEREKVTLYLDVGANRGQHARAVRAGGYAGRIISFEPLSAAYPILTNASAKDTLWECRNLALGGQDGTAQINVSQDLDSSSLLPIEKIAVEAVSYVRAESTETIQIRALDSLLPDIASPNDRIWLKLDVQGYELSVIAGAARALVQTQVVESEMSLVPLYTGQPLLCDVVCTMQDLGFDLISMEEEFTHPRTGQLFQVNGIFRRR